VSASTGSSGEGGDTLVEESGSSAGRSIVIFILRLVGAVAVPIGMFFLLLWTFDFLRDENANRFLVVAVAIVVGVGGVFFLYWAMNRVVDFLPERYREGVRPYVFVGPCLVILAVFLVYPVINTLLLSVQDANSEGFVGLDNFKFVFTDADRLRHGEAVAKSMIFLPLAISFVGAAVTWRLVYSFRPEGFGTNIGLLNGVVMGLGGEPVSWLSQQPWNNLYLMVIMIWMQTGFAMVVLSSAIKSIPDEIIEASRIDGASEMQVFRRIIVPSILPTIAVVTTYMVINAMKVFDIVYVIGSAETNGTEVIAERMLDWFFIADNDGRGAAIAVVLFIAVIPIMMWNVKRFREQEAIR
jgi:alpha-glucoside transport system permease protein